MLEFKTTEQILLRDWDFSELKNINYTSDDLPKQKHWLEDRNLSFEEVELWEEIYYQPGSLGIYAAWSPYAEIYVIVHCFYKDRLNGIELFLGSDAGKNVLSRAKQFDVELPVNRIWVESFDPIAPI